MKTTETLRWTLLLLAVAAVCGAGEAGYTKYARQKDLARRAQEAEGRGRFGKAAQAYSHSRHYATDNRTRAELLLREAECRVLSRDPQKALLAYTTLLESYPLYVPYERVLPRLRQLAGDFEHGVGSWLRLRNRPKAIAVYELILQETPAGSGLIEDSLNLGGLLTATHRPEEAIVVYREALRRFPGDRLAPRLRLELGRVLADECRRGDGDGQIARQAQRELQAFVKAQPDDPRCADAQFLLALVDARRADALYEVARFYQQPVHRRDAASRRYLAQIQRDYPGTTAAARAAVLLASLGPAPATPELPPAVAAGPAAPAVTPGAAPGEPEAAVVAAPPARAKTPPRRLLEGWLPGGRADEGQPRSFRTLEERENVQKWLLPLGDVNELKAAGGTR